jgi:hypothetical protein
MDQQGLLLCAKYAASPNFFGYCGPDESKSIVDHLKEEIADPELKHHLLEFETLYPYLELISRENKIEDPFDKSVVEAYWIGNSLLNRINGLDYMHFLTERLDFESKMDKKLFGKVKRKVMENGFIPHHTHHVFNIFKRTGKINSNHTIETMDSCRINWGKIIPTTLIQKSKIKSIFVETTQLVIKNQQLTIKPIIKEILIDYKGTAFIRNLKPNDFVSFHWRHVCDILTARQIKNLEFYTKKAIDYYNL